MPTSPQSNDLLPEAVDARLERLLRAKACIVYHENLPDREHPQVKCSIYGAPKSNELFVRISNGRVSFVAVAPSPVEFPVMGDRVFGLDAADHAAAFGLADQLWLKHCAALLAR
jgi:hypothetical protein